MNRRAHADAEGGARVSASTERWLSSREAAQYMGVAPSTAAKWRQRGIGPMYSCALGRDPRYRLSDLENFMAAGMTSNTVNARHIREREKAQRNG